MVVALDSAWVGRSGIPALAPQPVSSMDVFPHKTSVLVSLLCFLAGW